MLDSILHLHYKFNNFNTIYAIWLKMKMLKARENYFSLN